MTDWRFDLDQIRRNWDHATDLPTNERPSKFERVEEPKDAYKHARDALERVRGMALADAGKRATSVARFVDRTLDAINRLEEAGGVDEDGKLHADLDKRLAELEDLVVVIGELWR